MINLEKYRIEELVDLRNKIDNIISDYKDGYVYICNVRSYGRNWKENFIYNPYMLEQLMNEYDGENGIVDVYSTNPNLFHLHNYGELKYIQSVSDYDKWENYEYLKNIIPQIEKELDEWDNRDNTPFKQRPYFAPIYTREDLAEYKKRLEKYDMSFIPPQPYDQEGYSIH